MKKVLVITQYFPPRPGVAAIRLRGLAKYLPRFGWEPIILTTTLPGPVDQRFRVIQTSFHPDFSYRIKKILRLNPEFRLDQQEKPVVIMAGKDSFIFQIMEFIYGIINYPDELKGWIPFAIKEGSRIIREEEPDAILSSSLPVTTHLIARRLKMRFHTPWLADLRDLWTQNHYYQYGPIRKWFEKRLEIATLSSADALVTVSEPLAKKLQELHQNPYIVSIPNGFDPEEICQEKLTLKFTITYTGRLYDGKQDPSLLFGALQDLIRKKKIDPCKIEVRFWGSKKYWLEREIKKYGLETVAFQYGMLPREEILKKQSESQILLLLDWNDPREKGIYTGKVFEYLAARRPILAIGPQGVVSDLIERTRAGVHATNLDDLRELLQEFYRECMEKGKVSYYGQDEEINKYSHYEMARCFTEVLNKITHSHKEDGKSGARS